MRRSRATTGTPTITALYRSECVELLARNHFGRLARQGHLRVEMVPLNYVLSGEWLYGRTASGGKLNALAGSPWVAFEVDEVRGPFEWRSVVVHGCFYDLSGWDTHPRVRRHALGVIRKLMPEAMTDEDPIPSRDTLFRIHLTELDGRACALKPA